LLIVADDRERESGIPEWLGERAGVDVVVRRLKTGDYLVGSNVVVERKTLGDFAASIVDARLFKQATRLANASLRPMYIIEGGVSDLRQVGLTREALQGALISLSLIFNIPVLRSMDTEETGRLLIFATRQLMRVGENSWPCANPKAKGARAKKLRLLQALPGIGPEKARALLKEFASVEGCLTASADDLRRISGIGDKTAQGIRDVVSEDPMRYNASPRDWSFREPWF